MGYRIPGVFGTANQESEDGEAILFISPCCVIEKKISDLWTVLVLEEVTSKIKSHDWRNNKRPFQKDLQRILAYIYSCCLFFFSKFCFLGKVVVQYLTEYFCMPAPYVLGKSRWHYVIYRKESGKVKNISGTYQVNKVCWS